MNNRNMYWSGSDWVDANGSPQSPPKATTASTPGFWDYRNSGNADARNIFADRDDRNQSWGRARSAVSQLFNDYLTEDYYAQRKRKAQQQQMFDSYVQNIDSNQMGERAYADAMGGAGAASRDAYASAIALGMDPNAAALEARNQTAIAANDAKGRANDPLARQQMLGQAIALAKSVSDPFYADMLAQLIGYDLSMEGAAQQNAARNNQGGFGGIIGGITGLLGAGSGVADWKSVLGL